MQHLNSVLERNKSFSVLFGLLRPRNCDKLTKNSALGLVFGEFVTATWSELTNPLYGWFFKPPILFDSS